MSPRPLSSDPRRLAAVAAVMAAVSASYSAANHWHWREPALLALTPLDRLVPFVPAAMPVYCSHFVFLPLCLLALRSERVFSRALGALLMASALAVAAFLVWPTTFPRPQAAGVLFAFIRALDTPANCFPSLHAALACVAAWSLREDGHPRAPAAFAWAGAIVLSTVLVKQHYAADAAGGVLLAALSWRLCARAEPEPAGEPA